MGNKNGNHSGLRNRGYNTTPMRSTNMRSYEHEDDEVQSRPSYVAGSMNVPPRDRDSWYGTRYPEMDGSYIGVAFPDMGPSLTRNFDDEAETTRLEEPEAETTRLEDEEDFIRDQRLEDEENFIM